MPAGIFRAPRSASRRATAIAAAFGRFGAARPCRANPSGKPRKGLASLRQEKKCKKATSVAFFTFARGSRIIPLNPHEYYGSQFEICPIPSPISQKKCIRQNAFKETSSIQPAQASKIYYISLHNHNDISLSLCPPSLALLRLTPLLSLNARLDFGLYPRV